MKTKEQIEAEIGALSNMKPRVRKFTGFGDNNHDAIDVQIEVLSERLSLDEVHDRFSETAFVDHNEFDQHALDSALRACDWMFDRLADGEESPAQEWASLVGNVAPFDPYSSR